MAHPTKEYNAIFDALRDQKWVVETTSRGHYAAKPPDKNKSIVHFCITADPRSVHNTVRDLRKNGLVWTDRIAKPKKAAPDSSQEIEEALESEEGELVFPPSLPSPFPPLPPPPVLSLVTTPQAPAAPDVDSLFKALRDLKAERELWTEQVRRNQEEVEAATARLRASEEELSKVSDALASAKKAFDAAFEAEG